MDDVKSRSCEKKIIVEAESLDDAITLCKGSIDGIQFDKIPPEELKTYVETVKGINPGIVLLAAGGINENNVEDYAQTGVDAIVTTSVYFGKPVDIGVRIVKV
jgi:molybdenum transport protein